MCLPFRVTTAILTLSPVTPGIHECSVKKLELNVLVLPLAPSLMVPSCTLDVGWLGI